MEPYPPLALCREDFVRARTRMDDIIDTLSAPQMASCPQDVLEDYVTESGRELQRQLMQDQLDARARAEERRAAVTGTDGVRRGRVEAGHRRTVTTTVGKVEAERLAYRSPKVANLHPADAVLALPARSLSHPLRKLIALKTARSSVRQSADSITRATGQQLGSRQLMATTVHAATDILAFLDPATNPAAGTQQAGESDLLVMSIDATGVNMIPTALRETTRRAAQEAAEQAAGTAAGQAPSAQLSRRDRIGRTRMATVTAVYDATPQPRTAADIMPASRAERQAREEGPTAFGRQLDASLERSTTTMVTAMFDTAQQRDPEHRRRWIVLVDGANHQLDCLEREADKRGVHIDIIVDFVHVLEYAWRAADELHTTKNARTAWVADSARAILNGHSAQIVSDIRAGIRRLEENEPGRRTEAASRAAAYLEAKEPYLGYHLALALGWPIATGVIEGACRHLVKDRLDLAGSRWGLAGAEAVLLLRAVINNGDFDAYWAYHLQREYLRNHATRYDDELALAA